jgi:hypothetical protein
LPEGGGQAAPAPVCSIALIDDPVTGRRLVIERAAGPALWLPYDESG